MNPSTKDGVAQSVRKAPVFGVVRTDSKDDAAAQAAAFIEGGLEIIEITFTVPGATDLVRELLEARPAEAPYWVGMGTVTTPERAEAAIEAGAEFLVSPNTSAEVADLASEAGRFLLMGGLTATEIVQAWELGADMVKVYPLAPVGGPAYLSVVRQPLSDIPMLASGGFELDEIPAYAAAGAQAFGIGAPLLGSSHEESVRKVRETLTLARESVGSET